MNKELMQQALDALDNHGGNYKLTHNEAADINALCDAAQPVQPKETP